MILNLGKIRFNYTGTWAVGTTYAFNDVALYGGHLYCYIGTTPAAGTIPPTATASWSLMLRGFSNRGAWSNVTEYRVGELVTLGARVYQAILGHIGQKPPNGTYWTVLMEGTNFRGAYDNAATYTVRDVVAGTNGALYINKLESTGVAVTNTTNWDVYLPVPAQYAGTSTTSLLVGTGSKAFTGVATHLAYTVGQRLRASSVSGPANFMEGVVASFAGGTLTLTVDKIGGSGTLADWSINVAGQPGLDGVAGRILGSVALIAGSAVISNTLVDSDSVVFHSRQANGGTPGNITVSKTPGVSFTLTSDSGTDTSTIAWELIP